MEKKYLYVIVIAAIFGLMLVLPASAAISFQKYTPISNTMLKPVATRIPSVPVKNVSGPVQPLLIPWTQIPVNSKIFKPAKINSSGFQIHPVPTVIPVANNIDGQPRNTWWGTVTVWNKDHSNTVPDTTVKFYALIAPEVHCSDDGLSCSQNQGFISKLIGEGKTNSNGKLSIDLFTGGERLIKVNAAGPVISENGEQVYYSGGGDLSYESHSLDISLKSRNKVQ
jgi:hypothetical protein